MEYFQKKGKQENDTFAYEQDENGGMVYVTEKASLKQATVSLKVDYCK